MPNCCVPGCKEPAHHNVPKDRDQRLQWLHAIQRLDLLDSASPSRICRNHFSRNDYKEPDSLLKRSMLKRDAVPSVFSWSRPSTSSAVLNESTPPVLVAPSFSDVGLTNYTNFTEELDGSLFLIETPEVGVNEVIKIPQQKCIVRAGDPQKVIVTAGGHAQQKNIVNAREGSQQKVIAKASETKKSKAQVDIPQTIEKTKKIDNNKEYWRLKLMHIVHRPQFCGICLDFDAYEMDSVNDLFEIVVNERTHYKTLLDIADAVFKETENIANSNICKKCSTQLINSYVFIQNYKESSQMLNNFLNEIYKQTCSARDQIRAQKKCTVREAYISLTNCYFGNSCSNEATESQPAKPQQVIVTNVRVLKPPTPVEPKSSTLLASYKTKLQDAKFRQNNHICKKCGTILNSEQALIKHYKLHTKVPTKIGSFACPYCDMSFSNQRFCEAHKGSCGAHKRDFLCNTCAAAFDTMMELTHHIKVKHAKRIYRCTLCEKAFLNEANRNEHMEQNHGNKKHCVVCQETFFSVADLLVHMRSHRPGVKYTCEVCSAEFDDLRVYRAHCVKHTGPMVTCSLCQKEVRQSGLKKHMATRHKKPMFKCSTCGEVFEHNILLKYHQIAHLPGMPYPKYDLLVNPDRPPRSESVEDSKEESDPLKIPNPDDQTAETQSKPQRKIRYCQFCDYTTKAYGTFKSHMNRYHLKIRPFVCKMCNKAYRSKVNLRNHMAIHTGNRVECPLCKKEVPERNLKLHMRCHIEDHRFTCQICGKTFVSKVVFEQHKLTHPKGESSVSSVSVIAKDSLDLQE